MEENTKDVEQEIQKESKKDWIQRLIEIFALLIITGELGYLIFLLFTR